MATKTDRSSALGQPATRRRITIYDLARTVEASPATVSMVLNDKWQENRISHQTAERILEAARTAGYSANRRARGLRLAQSGLAGMIIPQYQNRFFAEMSEAFEAEARKRGLCPIVVSTKRVPATEIEVVETLLAHQVETLFLAGATDAAPLNQRAQQAGVRCINIDLPGSGAPSVVTDNRGGARMLTSRLRERMRPNPQTLADRLHFLGGPNEEYATQERIAGFREALSATEDYLGTISVCGYEPDQAAIAAEQLYQQLGRLPAGLFVNSITAFEGVVSFLKTLPKASFDDVTIGCFDWNPFATFLPFPVVMVAQDVEKMMTEAFQLAESGPIDSSTLVAVPPRLIETQLSPDFQTPKT